MDRRSLGSGIRRITVASVVVALVSFGATGAVRADDAATAPPPTPDTVPDVATGQPPVPTGDGTVVVAVGLPPVPPTTVVVDVATPVVPRPAAVSNRRDAADLTAADLTVSVSAVLVASAVAVWRD